MLPAQIDRYQIISECGRGGMAVVYRAFDPQRQMHVALKVLLRGYIHDERFRARFKREIDIHSNFRHEAVVPIYGYGQAQGQLYLVLGYMAGGSLEDRLKNGKTLPLEEVLALLERIAPALDAAHRQGIIHRDLKPSNILFDEKGQAFISDFGIARLAEQASQLTGTSMVGSPAYISPEQARPQTAPDARTDLYSLGVMVYEMLTGKLPYFDSNPVKLVIKQISDPTPDIRADNPRLPPGCTAFIYKAMAKKPEQRYSSAGEMVAALAQTMRPAEPSPKIGAPLPAERPSLQVEMPAPSKPRPLPPVEPRPEQVPTPHPLKPAGLGLPLSMPTPYISKTSLPAFLRPFARFLRLPSWSQRVSTPYINIPAPLRPFLGRFGIPRSLALPKNFPGWALPPLTILIILIVILLLIGAGVIFYLVLTRGIFNNFPLRTGVK